MTYPAERPSLKLYGMPVVYSAFVPKGQICVLDGGRLVVLGTYVRPKWYIRAWRWLRRFGRLS